MMQMENSIQTAGLFRVVWLTIARGQDTRGQVRARQSPSEVLNLQADTSTCVGVRWLVCLSALCALPSRAYPPLRSPILQQALLATPVQGVYTWRCYLARLQFSSHVQ